MKKYVIIIGKDETRIVDISESSEIMIFDNVSKTIVDNITKSKKEVLEIIEKEYGYSRLNVELDYIRFIKELKNEGITNKTILKIIKTDESKINRSLKTASIEIINKCPFRCDHCYIPQEKQIMDYKTYKKIVDELSKMNCKELLITGGEPMLHPDFIKMYLYAKKKGLITVINSNLYLLTDEILKIFIKYKPFNVEVSLYGYDDKSYEKFTHVKNGFTIVNNNIERLHNNDIKVLSKSILTKRSLDSILEIKKYAKNKKLPFKYDYFLFPKLDQNKPNDELCSIPEILNIIKSDKDSSKLFEKLTKKLNTKRKLDVTHVFQCSVGEDRLFIDSFLNVRPCLVVPIIYNYKDYSLKEIFMKYSNIKNQILFNDNDKCKNCNKKLICRYCPGKFLMETGSYHTPPQFYCDLTDEIIKEYKND